MSESDDEISALIAAGQPTPALARIAFRHMLAAERQAVALETILVLVCKLAEAPPWAPGGPLHKLLNDGGPMAARAAAMFDRPTNNTPGTAGHDFVKPTTG